MEPEQLAQLIKDHFDGLASRYGLEGSATSVERVSHAGSVQRRSLTISDGEIEYHLKLAYSPDHIDKLRKWYGLNQALHERYRAPLIADWIDIPDTGFSGLLCEHVAGRPADLGASPRLTREIVDLASRLHVDEEMRARLLPLTPDGTCGDYFNSVWIRRFKEDLAITEAQPPGFVPSETLQWMRGETLEIGRMVAGMEAFSPKASSPVHGDLWNDNILVADDGRWRIVDWDDIALGDPALEFAVLLEPILEQNLGASLADLLPYRPDVGFSQRLEVCLRAQRLYRAIESLANYIEADVLGERADRVREENETLHRVALRSYKRRYGAG